MNMQRSSTAPFGRDAEKNSLSMKGEIDQALDTQRSWLTTIEEEMTSLNSRLNFVLQSPLPTTIEAADNRSGGQCPLGEMLKANNERIITIANHLTDILSRLQL